MNLDFQSSDERKKIFSFHETIENRIITRENSWLEFKESFNWNSKDIYAKSMASFANNKGGYIVFGIKDKPRDFIGLQSSNFEDIDEAKITEYLNSIFSPEIIFEKFVITVKSKKAGLLFTKQAEIKPTVCLKNDNKLKEADIYYRYNSRSEKIKYPELKAMFDFVKEEERKNWMEALKKILEIGPTNAVIMDIATGEIRGKNGTLMIDKKLIPKLKFINQGSPQEKGTPVLKLIGDVKPVSIISEKNKNGVNVQITKDPKAPTFKIEEESHFKSNYPLSHSDLLKGCKKRYSNFKQGKEFNDIKRDILKKDEKFADQWPANYKKPKPSDQYFYSTECYKVLDRYYKKKQTII